MNNKRRGVVRLATRPIFRSTRDSRIRYDLKSVMRQRAHDKQVQRQQATRGRYVVGRFILDGSTVVLEAVAWVVGVYTIEAPHDLQRDFSTFARWRTRQAARQWMLRHPDPRCQIVNLEQLPGRDPEPGPVVTVTTDNPPRRRRVVTATTPLAGAVQ